MYNEIDINSYKDSNLTDTCDLCQKEKSLRKLDLCHSCGAKFCNDNLECGDVQDVLLSVCKNCLKKICDEDFIHKKLQENSLKILRGETKTKHTDKPPRFLKKALISAAKAVKDEFKKSRK